MLLDIILYLICCLLFPERDKAEVESKSKSKYRMREVENESELFFTDKCDFDDAFKL